MRCLPGARKAKTPIIFLFLAGEKINGAYLNCIEAVALYREYMCMLRKLQDPILRLLLPCNISADRCD
ncbi:RepA leader peptide Tap [Salmonella enterica subsp. enterica]|nr:RepA leader peptide Tap [Salmonella enterica subsp. enterica serovar Hvittingfoss]EDR5814848.1 RepA leader peptide Tap [Salmonella enterica subsp. enterica serovar Soumbedioune]